MLDRLDLDEQKSECVTVVDMSAENAPEVPPVKTSKSFVQASFRLSPETHQTIRELAVAKNWSQSEVMRAAAALLRHTERLPTNIVLATVNLDDCVDSRYKVQSWVLTE